MRTFLGICVVGIVIVSFSAFFIVDQRSSALVLQFGLIKRVVNDAGLHFKFPLIQNVIYFDKRIQTLDSEEPQRFITSEKKNVLVDSFVKWRIMDPQLFYVTVVDQRSACLRLGQTINSGLREEFGKRTVKEVISSQREDITRNVLLKAEVDAKRMGVEIIDIRLRRVELPEEVSESVYRRMRAERERVASELRALGAADAEKIKADADKQREIIVSKAYEHSQIIKGEGDAKAGVIYAKAFSQDQNFYSFYRSLTVYRNSFHGKSDFIVIDPSSKVFRYFNDDVVSPRR